MKKLIRQLTNTWCLLRISVITLCTSMHICWIGKRLKKNPFEGDAVILGWAQKLLTTVEAKVVVHNPDNVDVNTQSPTIIMVNHNSLFDIPICYQVFQNRLRMIAKKELFTIPFFGPAMRNAGHVAMDRENPRKAVKSLQTAKQAIQDGALLWIAPEGTRSPDGRLQAFKTGGFKLAIASGANIIPVTICGAEQLMAKGSLYINHHQTIDVHISKPIDTTPFSNKELSQLMDKVKSAISAKL